MLSRLKRFRMVILSAVVAALAVPAFAWYAVDHATKVVPTTATFSEKIFPYGGTGGTQCIYLRDGDSYNTWNAGHANYWKYVKVEEVPPFCNPDRLPGEPPCTVWQTSDIQKWRQARYNIVYPYGNYECPKPTVNVTPSTCNEAPQTNPKCGNKVDGDFDIIH